MLKSRQVYICENCGYESLKWNGQCPQCKEWNTLTEQTVKESAAMISRASGRVYIKRISEVKGGSEMRFSTGMREFDRGLGGGLVPGSLTLVGGDPGIGKSTLMLQICQFIGADKEILYISGEESMSQIKLRADRLGVNTQRLSLLCETNIDTV